MFATSSLTSCSCDQAFGDCKSRQKSKEAKAPLTWRSIWSDTRMQTMNIINATVMAKRSHRVFCTRFIYIPAPDLQRSLIALAVLSFRTSIAVFGCSLFQILASAATTTSISQWGITWQFSEPREYGQFANGDYWVVGPVTITNMSPAWDGTYNGWEVNPTVQSKQGFLAGTGAGGTYDESLRPAMPFVVTSGSLVKTIGGTTTASASRIKTAVVLTVLTAAPPGGGSNVFRPPYVGSDKPLYLVSNLRRELLPAYPAVADAPTLATVAANFSKCLRMDHHSSVPRWFRPSDAMKDYQPENTRELNEAMLRLMLDDSHEAKLPALIQFTQHTIDRAHAVLLGHRKADDGHNPNHRVLAAWAATLLDITAIKTYLATATGFHEDAYLIAGINQVLWGESGYPEFNYWNHIMTGSGSQSLKDPYSFIDGGKLSSGGAAYQNIVSQSLKGQALVYGLLPPLINCIPTQQWNNLFQYAERWVNVGVWAIPDPAAPYDGVPANYGVTFGPNGAGGYIPGSGRFTQYHGANKDGGQYKSAFVASMWNAYAKVPSSPSGLRVLQE